MFVLIFVILIVMSAAILKKSHYDNENQRLFFWKIEIRSNHKWKPLLLCFMKETLCSRKGRQLEKKLTDGTEGWIESNAIREVK
jgi:hypothetical protein